MPELVDPIRSFLEKTPPSFLEKTPPDQDYAAPLRSYEAPRRKPVLSFDLYPKRAEHDPVLGEALNNHLRAPPDRRSVDPPPGSGRGSPINLNVLSQDAAETAALRTRESVRPTGGRQEGETTQAITHLPGAMAELGPDLSPAHLPDTKPQDYLRELYQNPDILQQGIDQATHFVGRQ